MTDILGFEKQKDWYSCGFYVLAMISQSILDMTFMPKVSMKKNSRYKVEKIRRGCTTSMIAQIIVCFNKWGWLSAIDVERSLRFREGRKLSNGSTVPSLKELNHPANDAIEVATEGMGQCVPVLDLVTPPASPTRTRVQSSLTLPSLSLSAAHIIDNSKSRRMKVAIEDCVGHFISHVNQGFRLGNPDYTYLSPNSKYSLRLRYNCTDISYRTKCKFRLIYRKLRGRSGWEALVNNHNHRPTLQIVQSKRLSALFVADSKVLRCRS